MILSLKTFEDNQHEDTQHHFLAEVVNSQYYLTQSIDNYHLPLYHNSRKIYPYLMKLFLYLLLHSFHLKHLY